MIIIIIVKFIYRWLERIMLIKAKPTLFTMLQVVQYMNEANSLTTIAQHHTACNITCVLALCLHQPRTHLNLKELISAKRGSKISMNCSLAFDLASQRARLRVSMQKCDRTCAQYSWALNEPLNNIYCIRAVHGEVFWQTKQQEPQQCVFSQRHILQ